MDAQARHTTGSIAAYLAERLGSARGGVELVGARDLEITHLSTVEHATPGALTFIRSDAYAQGWAANKATAALVSRAVTPGWHHEPRRALILVPDADLALNLVLDLMAPETASRPPGVHPSSVVSPSASLGKGVSIGPQCTVEEGAAIGDGSVLIAGVFIGRDARIGRGCTLHPGVCLLERCILGDGCILHAGVVIGADGFGYRPAPDGRGVVKIPHIGHVEIGSDVEIGANSCVDRAKFGATTIGDGTKLDNLVQVGHGVRIGRACLICGQVGLAGSSVLGDGVIMAGQAGVSDSIKVGDGAMIAAQSGVTKDLPPGASVFGMPAMPATEFYRDQIILRSLARQIQALRARGIDPLALLTPENLARLGGPVSEPVPGH